MVDFRSQDVDDDDDEPDEGSNPGETPRDWGRPDDGD